MTPEQKALREAVARALWESVCDVAEEYRDAVWSGTYEDCGVVLQDENFDGFSWQGRVLGRNTFRGLADAAIAVALERAAKVAEVMLGSYTTMDNIPDAIRALIPRD